MVEYKKKNAVASKGKPLAIEVGKNGILGESEKVDRRGWVECISYDSFAAFGQWFLGMNGKRSAGQQRYFLQWADLKIFKEQPPEGPMYKTRLLGQPELQQTLEANGFLQTTINFRNKELALAQENQLQGTLAVRRLSYSKPNN